VINIISSEYNSNYKELISSLNDINYLGTLDYNLQDKTGMLFNKEV
jgi:magnesium-transporting ATPase (P-type)